MIGQTRHASPHHLRSALKLPCAVPGLWLALQNGHDCIWLVRRRLPQMWACRTSFWTVRCSDLALSLFHVRRTAILLCLRRHISMDDGLLLLPLDALERLITIRSCLSSFSEGCTSHILSIPFPAVHASICHLFTPPCQTMPATGRRLVTVHKLSEHRHIPRYACRFGDTTV